VSSYLRKLLASKWTKVAVFLLCLVPLGDLVYRGFHARLTANPVEFVQHFTGDWTLRFLLITLSITPLRKLLNLPELIRFLVFVLLIPLAITSTKGWIRRLGGRRWQILHRSIYVAAICGVIHYYWLVKSDVREPLMYAAVLAILLLWRLATWFVNQKGTLAPATKDDVPEAVVAPDLSRSSRTKRPDSFCRAAVCRGRVAQSRVVD
jgi:methionine sulfoxide reductase heme-binding subunit